MNRVLGGAFREHWGRLLALLATQFRRLDLAEDALADAYAAASERWPLDGVPANPPAWLLTAARRGIVDRLRHESVLVRKAPLLVVDHETRLAAERAIDLSDLPAEDGTVVDERLRLIFLCTHPSLSVESAAALTLRLVLGVSTTDLARLFLVKDATMSARLTRARHTLAAVGAPFRLPAADELPERTAAVLSVIHLAFTAAYAPVSGSAVSRPDLAGDAIGLTRLLRDRLPGPEIDALLALMVLQHSRRDARADPAGRLILLPDQDRGRWRRDEIAEGLALLAGLRDAELSGLLGEYLLQARIAAEHARAETADRTRWDLIAAHYAELERITDSPLVRLNRAVAVAEAEGPQAGLPLLDGLAERLPGNHRVPGIRARLLAALGRSGEARTAYDEALARCRHEPTVAELRRQRAALDLR